MGSNIPLPELDLRPLPVPDRNQQMGNLINLQRLGMEQQESDLRQQQTQQQLQMGQIQLNDQQAMSKAMQQWDGKDMNDLPGLLIKNKASANAVMGMRNQILDYQTKLSNLTKDQLQNAGAFNDMIAGHIEAVKAMPAEQQAQGLESAKADLVKRGALSPQEASQMVYQGPESLDVYEKFHTAHSAQVEQALKGAQTQQAQQAEQASEATEEKTRLETELMKQYGTPEQQQAKYVSLAQRKAQGIPLSPPDQAFMTAVEKYKSIAPTATFNLQNAGMAGQGGQPSAIAQAVASGQMKWGDVISPRTPQSVKEGLLKEIKQINPNFNSGDFQIEQDVRKDFTSGGAAKNLTAFNTAIEHAGQLRTAADALDNGDLPTLNKIGNVLGYQFGSDKTTNFNVIKNALSGEISKVFKGGEATDAEIKAVQEPFSNANSPAQLKGAIDNAVKLMNSKREALQQQYKSGMQGQPNFGNPQSGMILMRAPNGQTKPVPADQVEHYKSLGATVAQ